MPSLLTQAVRSRALAFAVHAGLWLILVLALANIGAKRVPYREAVSFTVPPSSPVPVGKLNQLFSPTNWPQDLPATNQLDPFFTRHFVPPPGPAPAPPPTTRKIDLTYRGFMQSPEKGRHVLVNLSTNFLVLQIGEALATNTFVADASMQFLTVTNAAAQTNQFPLNVKGQIEVPIK